MNMRTSSPALELANKYAKFYVQDFAGSVMKCLRGSYPLPEEDFRKVVEEQMAAALEHTNLKIANTNTVGRFLYECASFALESNLENASSREAWDHVSSLPSIHHRELDAIAYASADQYHSTMNQTVIGTIARDADTAAKLINQVAQTRTNSTETGGTFNLFSWGILNDGMWLNAALQRACDRAHIFKPDATVTVGWSQTAFNFAHQAAILNPLTPEQRADGAATVAHLLSKADPETVTALLNGVSQDQLNTILFSAGGLSHEVTNWDRSRQSSKAMIGAVASMSTVARLLQILEQNAAAESNEMVSLEVRERLAKATEAVTMSLVAAEALRETRFANTLIMSVEAEGTDPKVDVFVNSDNIANYRGNNGQDDDLVQFGIHLDPRQGLGDAPAGWSLQYVLDRREQVIPQVMAQQTERLQQLRNNDAHVIRTEASRITRETVQSYLAARSINDIPPVLHQSIGRFTQDLTSVQANMRVDERLTDIFAQATGDEFVQKATSAFVGYMKSDLNQHATAATIAHLAVADAIDFIVGADTPSLA